MDLAYIVSLPRSGSTVLTSMLDKQKGIIYLPESAFPQILGELDQQERHDPQWLAALYVASSFSGTQLSMEEAARCMQGDNKQILVKLGLAVAEKTGRNPDQVSLIVWKTTRMVSCQGGPLSTGGNYVVLRRHPHNVYESQFRVPFGTNNRRPARFGIFHASYEAAFLKIPKKARYELEYEQIPVQLESLMTFMGARNQGLWEGGHSSIDDVVATRPWHLQIRTNFNSTDADKRKTVNVRDARVIDFFRRYGLFATRCMISLRKHYDWKSFLTIRAHAKKLMEMQINENELKQHSKTQA